MNISIESTERVVTVNNAPARVWQGKTESGIPIVCCITRIAVAENQDQVQFQKELQSKHAPIDVGFQNVFPLKMII